MTYLGKCDRIIYKFRKGNIMNWIIVSIFIVLVLLFGLVVFEFDGHKYWGFYFYSMIIYLLGIIRGVIR